jgi:hypothetical protein
MRIYLATTCAVIATMGMAHAQLSPSAPISDQDYMKRVMLAAPPQIVAEATIVRMKDGAMQTLKKGVGQWTCMENGGVPMCMDPNAMEWAHAWQSHGPATEKTGFIYMLAGDNSGQSLDTNRLARNDRRRRCEDHGGRLSAISRCRSHQALCHMAGEPV